MVPDRASIGTGTVPELGPGQPSEACRSTFVQWTPKGAHNDLFYFSLLQDVDEIAENNGGPRPDQMQFRADAIALSPVVSDYASRFLLSLKDHDAILGLLGTAKNWVWPEDKVVEGGPSFRPYSRRRGVRRLGWGRCL
ncbi:hypothetical protein GSI_08205 [Ganoderma sinense ZZ0214-1]|uniref:Uncharacterized protein n=1 Tax=Ganoderma sinense ZZ0214-1 TaxID=1077348 RepID=A0A2G8S715_9APHY|nr:hypothetical protein GSI_08205 [Ganoderma sinense ZZ0214-1]